VENFTKIYANQIIIKLAAYHTLKLTFSVRFSPKLCGLVRKDIRN